MFIVDAVQISYKLTKNKKIKLIFTVYIPKKSATRLSPRRTKPAPLDLMSRLIGEYSSPKYPLKEAIIRNTTKNSIAPKALSW